MPKDIKKKTASHIYYGLNVQTGALQHISEVPGGRKCDCICVSCKQPFEARKGSVRRHHFAHVSNYECMYASEVAIYKALANCLEAKKAIVLPPIHLRFPAWSRTEVLSERKDILLDSVTFQCEAFAYPPTLKVKSKTSDLQILLDFDYYYDETSLNTLAATAREEGVSLLLYHLPAVKDDASYTPERLTQVVDTAEKAEWVFSRLEYQWRERYTRYATQPLEHGSGYLCPISVGCFKGKYSARWTDCAYCEFNIAEPPGCLCMAKAGIKTPKDFHRSQVERTADMEKIRLANEKSIVDSQRKNPMQFKARHTLLSAVSEPPKSVSTVHVPTQAELDSAYEEVAKGFDASSTEWTVDRFNRRWLQCQICGEIKQDTQMASYGGSDGVNRGICSACSRRKTFT